MLDSLDSIFGLRGQVAVVTGGGDGLGREICLGLASAGATVVCADLRIAGAKETVAMIESLGGKGLAYACDVADEAGVTAMFEDTAKRFGRIDILFNNAGISDRVAARLHECATDDWNKVVAVNLGGTFFCSRAAITHMLPKKRGKIVNIASMWGLAGASSIFPIPAYNASKGAVVNLTRELGLEYAQDNIQVNAICPGFYRTSLADGAYEDPEFVAAITAFTPMGRVADAREIRGPALFLASSASDFITGTTVVADGGCIAK
jgi:NAD(P)-dependent dehydrogenase (short-subunit alcohol dehydrogenase family)